MDTAGRQLILDQLAHSTNGLGTSSLASMIFANTFVGLENGIKFNFKGSRRFNGCQIVLNEYDLYDMKLYRLTRKGLINSDHTNLHAEDLAETFTRETGLYTHL